MPKKEIKTIKINYNKSPEGLSDALLRKNGILVKSAPAGSGKPDLPPGSQNPSLLNQTKTNNEENNSGSGKKSDINPDKKKDK